MSKPKPERYQRLHLNGEYRFTEALSRILRQGYNRGQEDYDRGNDLGFQAPMSNTELEGWYMGWNAREAVESRGLQLSPVGHWAGRPEDA